MIKFYAKSFAAFFICFLLLNTCTSKKASAEEAEKPFSFSGQIKVSVPYVSEWTGEFVSNRAVTQPSITLTHNPSGMYINVSGYIADKLSEIDFYLGKTTEIKGIALDTGVGFYNIEDLNNMDGDYFAIYVGAEFPEVIGIVPIAYAEANLPIHKSMAEGGWLWKFGGKKSVEIYKQPVEIKVEAGGNDGIYGSEPKIVSFARGTVSTEIKISDWKLSSSLALQKGFGGIAGQEWRAIVGLTLLF